MPIQHIRMISEGSYETDDWNDGCWKFSFAITEKKCILKYIQIEMLFYLWNNSSQYYFLLYFRSNKCSPDDPKMTKPTFLNSIDQNGHFWHFLASKQHSGNHRQCRCTIRRIFLLFSSGFLFPQSWLDES